MSKTKYVLFCVKEMVLNYIASLMNPKIFFQCLWTNVVRSYQHITYSWYDMMCYRDVEHFLRGKTVNKWHDMDKILMFVFVPWLGPEVINNIHIRIQSHHPKYWNGETMIGKDISDIDWYQAVIDWECARYTKLDKPLNAYDTMLKYYNDDESYKACALSVMKDLDLIKYNGKDYEDTYTMRAFETLHNKWYSFIVTHINKAGF